jgi:hypothetical protein
MLIIGCDFHTRYQQIAMADDSTRVAHLCGFCKGGNCFGLSCNLVGAVGIEPTTFGLKGRCSTTELRPWI